MGANGAGKSTLVKIITGVFPADEGEMILAGQPVAFRSPAEARRAGIVVAIRTLRLCLISRWRKTCASRACPSTRSRRRCATSASNGSIFRTTARDVDFAVLRLIDLARALASDPHILMLDEITAALPADLSERVFKVVRDFRVAARASFSSRIVWPKCRALRRATVLRDGVTVGVTPTKGGEETIVNLMLGLGGGAGDRRRRSPRLSSAVAGRAPALEVEGLSYGHA